MSHLLPRFHRRSLARLDAQAVDTAVREAGDREEFRPKSSITKPGDPRRLRGVPVCAMGVGGVSPGTDPLAELLRRSA